MPPLYIVAPSGIVDAQATERAIERLRSLGHKVSVDRALARRWLRFAGTDAERSASLARATSHRASRVVIAARGGYGLSRILTSIDYTALAASGKQFVGHSDFTALNLALLARARAPSWQGPCALADFGAHEPPDPFMLAQWQCALARQCTDVEFHAVRHDAGAQRTKAGGLAGTPITGTLWGGNLAMLISTLATPYLPRVSGGILFLEDIGELPYRVDRLLMQLINAGIAQRQRAIVLGRFTRTQQDLRDVHEENTLFRFSLDDVFGHFARAAGVPVLSGLPFGHVPAKAMLRVGERVTLHVEPSGRARILGRAQPTSTRRRST